MSSCCVVGCSNRHSGGFKTYSIPTGNRPWQSNRRRLWLQAIKRTDWTEDIIKNARVCSAHFISGEASMDYDSPDFVPSVFNRVGFQQRVRRTERFPGIQPDSLVRSSDEKEPWTDQGRGQLQGLQSDTTHSIFTSPEESSQLPPLDQSPTVENRERDSLPTNTTEQQTNTTEQQTNADCDEKDRGAPEPPSDSLSRTPDHPTDHSPSPGSSSKTPDRPTDHSPSPGSHSGSEGEDASPGGAESKTVQKSHQCEECGRVFKKKCGLAMHSCGKFLMNNLASHSRIHTGEKPHQCEVCGDGFRLKSSLIKHGRIHTGYNPYQCEICDEAFRDPHGLSQHRRTHIGQKLYECEECDKGFTTKEYLIHHHQMIQHKKSTSDIRSVTV